MRSSLATTTTVILAFAIPTPSGSLAAQAFNADKAGHPEWSPEGEWIAFDAQVNGQRAILISRDGGAPEPLLSSAQLPPEIEVTELADGVFLFRAPSEMDKWTSSNSVAFIGDDGVVMFDTNTLPSVSALVLEELRKITEQPVRFLVNSHWHQDHWSGNEVYADAFPGMQIIASYETAHYMSLLGSEWFSYTTGAQRLRDQIATAKETGETADGTPVTDALIEEAEATLAEREVFEAEVAAVRRTEPTMVYSDSMSFRAGGREFKLYSIVGDATGSTIMYVPEDDMLVTGDALARQENGQGAQPWTMNSYDVAGWLEGLKVMESFGAGTIVPGQGPAFEDNGYVATTHDMYASIIRQTHAALRAGHILLSDIQDQVDLEEFRTRYGLETPGHNSTFDAIAGSLIKRVVQAARDGRDAGGAE